MAENNTNGQIIDISWRKFFFGEKSIFESGKFWIESFKIVFKNFWVILCVSCIEQIKTLLSDKSFTIKFWIFVISVRSTDSWFAVDVTNGLLFSHCSRLCCSSAKKWMFFIILINIYKWYETCWFNIIMIFISDEKKMYLAKRIM